MNNDKNKNDDDVLNAEYWQNRYLNQEHGWDIGSASTPLATYIEQLTDKQIKILIPGCGNSYEAELLISKGFNNVHLLDYAPEPLKNFSIKNPAFPKSQLHCEDFFTHQGEYDLILEQTFFCALNPALRKQYALKMFDLLKNNGTLAGLLFNCEFEKAGPPFGGNIQEYERYFSPLFAYIKMTPASNSIPQRAGRELFIIIQKTVPSRG
jgi:methyl halide transferase